MSDIAIQAEALSKRYRIGARQERYKTFRDKLTYMILGPLRKLSPSSQRETAHQEIWALKDVSFQVKRGEVVGIIGLNGAGKSTLLKILSRITEPTEGLAKIHGRVGSLLEVGTGFHPELTGRENILLNGAILGMKRREIGAKFDEIVTFAELEKFIDTPVKHYSSGMYMRLAFAVAAHLEPEILLVDEVLAVGDAIFQKKCLGKMNDVAKEGRTLLFVSHNMGAIKSLCHRAMLVDKGSIAQHGKVDEVVEAYLMAGREKIKDGIVPEDRPRSGTGEARIRWVEMLNQNDHAITQLYLGQKFRVALTVEVLKDIRDAGIGVLIHSPDGICVASSFSTDGNQPFRPLTKGWYRIVLELQTTFIPHNYNIGAAIFHSDGRDIDYLEQILDFCALGVAENSSDRYLWNCKHGFVRLVGIWQEPQRIQKKGSAHVS